MAQEGYANNATSTLSGNITSGATSLSVQAGDGAKFPASDFDIVIGTEIIHVGSRSTDTFNSLTRGAQSTTAAAHNNTDPVKHVLTRDALKRLGTVIHDTGAQGSRPSASLEGRLYLPNDGSDISRDTGALWQPWGPIYPLTAPIDGDFAWVNQGGATVSTANGGILLRAPAATGDNLRIRKKAAPATPYTITVCIRALAFAKQFLGYGLLFRDAGGKVAVFGWSGEGTGLSSLVVNKFNSATSFNSQYVAVPTIDQPMFLRIADDGTDRICSVSPDGYNWVVVHQVGRTDFLTATEVGFGINALNNITPNYDVLLHLLSWKEA